MNSLCCPLPEKNDLCLARKCKNCCDKKILFEDFDPEQIVSYHEWQRSKVAAKPKKTKKDVNDNNADNIEPGNKIINVKALCEKSALEVVDLLQQSVDEYMAHISRYISIKL